MSLYLNFRRTFINSGGQTKFLPVELNSYPEISVHFLFKFELNVDSFGSRIMTDDSCWLVLLLYVPSQQLWSLRDGQFT